MDPLITHTLTNPHTLIFICTLTHTDRHLDTLTCTDTHSHKDTHPPFPTHPASSSTGSLLAAQPVSWSPGSSRLSHSPQFSSVQSSHSVMSESLQSHGLQHARPPCPSPALTAYSDSCPSSWRCHPTISFSAIPFSSRALRESQRFRHN